MRKTFFLLTAFFLILSACSPAALQPQATSSDPFSEVDLQSTVVASVQQTLEAMPTPTTAPSDTPVVITATSAPTQTQAPTATQNPTLLTLTATLGTGTVTAGPLSFTSTPTVFSATPAGTNHYQYYGTMPPNLPSGKISLRNMSKADAYISLQCTTRDGYVTVIEYPVGGSTVNTSAPAGSYVYVAWVGGKKMTGSFKLDKYQGLTIIMYKDHVETK